MRTKRSLELTSGPIIQTILGLALPIMASSFLGTLYNLCDMAWVGMLGARVVAGVGVGGMYLWLASGFALLPRMGGQVLAAQALGAGDTERARTVARAAIRMIILFGLIFGAICLLGTGQLISFFRLTDTESKQAAFGYIRITCGLIVFSFLNLTLTGLYTSQGDSRTPMLANLCGLGLNMLLDPLLIIGVGFLPRLEAVGAALATVLAQVCVTLILLARMRTGSTERDLFRGQDYLKPCPADTYRSIARIGTPAALQSMVYCGISMLLTRFVAAYGAEAVAVARVGGQIESVSWNTADGFSSAINSFCGQNYGAGEYGRIRKGYVFSVVTSLLWGIAVLACFLLLPEPISSVFFHEADAIAITVEYLIIIGLSEPFLMTEIVTQGALSGLGRTRLSSLLSIPLTALRIPLALAARSLGLGAAGIWWAMSITSILKGSVLTIVFLCLHPERAARDR